MIQQMKFSGYFLIVWDFIRFAKSKNIPVGPGRGSAAGSLVSYAMEITDIDPLQYGLLFERFLNPERISMPDIDIDFCMNRRGEVIQYVTEKYGREQVAQIITFNTLGARAAIKDVGRVLDMSFADVDRITKLVPNVLNIKLKDAIEKSRASRNWPNKIRACRKFSTWRSASKASRATHRCTRRAW
jgi:DNA polymerase III subunit alpha